jgi:hypothetical protein
MRPSRLLWTSIALAACSPSPKEHAAPIAAVRFAPDTARADLPEAVRRICSAPAPASEGKPARVPGARPASFRVVSQEEQTGIEAPLRCVVRTPAEWGALQAFGKLPFVEFPGGTLLVAAMGRQPSTAESISVEGVTARGDTVTAVVVAHQQSEGGDLITFPVVIVHLPLRPAVVEFVERLQFEP